MRTLARIPVLALLAAASTACLENEEEIEVRPDGSVHVVVHAEGDVPDLADGYPVPLGAGWMPRTLDTERWLREMGPDTGSLATRQRLEEALWPIEAGEEAPQAELRVERTFASVGNWPAYFAPASDPYRTATMERTARLEIRDVGARKVFVFERVYGGFDYARLDVSTRSEEELGEIWPRFEEQNPFSAGEWRSIRERAGEIHAEVAELFVRDALVALFTSGDAAPSPHVLPAVLAETRRAADASVSLDVLHELNRLLVADDDEGASGLLERFEVNYRDAIRGALARSLADQGVGEPAVNAALFSLEWGFSAFDHYTDLSDETFVISVRMPGVLVGGNFLQASGNLAEWAFEGEDLLTGDVALRVVSVLE